MQLTYFPAVEYSTYAFARRDSSSLHLVITAYPFDKRSAISTNDGRTRCRVDNPPLTPFRFLAEDLRSDPIDDEGGRVLFQATT